MHDFYARYLPQMALAASVPLLIVITLFPINWAAALILLATAPLIPIFMAMVGMARPMRTDAISKHWRV
jgi:ATP-binding cassette subfamily C protein CydD